MALNGTPLLITSLSVVESYLILVYVFELSAALIQLLYGTISLYGPSPICGALSRFAAPSVGLQGPSPICGALSRFAGTLTHMWRPQSVCRDPHPYVVPSVGLQGPQYDMSLDPQSVFGASYGCVDSQSMWPSCKLWGPHYDMALSRSEATGV